MREFILKKDIQTPTYTIQAGAVFRQRNNHSPYYCSAEDYYCHQSRVENNTEWFEEVIEKQYTKRDMIYFAAESRFFIKGNAYTIGSEEQWYSVLSMWENGEHLKDEFKPKQ